MMAATCAHVAVLTLAPALTGCSSAPPRPVYQRPVRSQYKGWTAEVLKALAQQIESRRCVCGRAGVPVSRMQESHSSNLPHLLRPRSQGGGEERGSDDEERAALHRYSITWSARRSNDCGTVRPSALAVFRLITSSKFVG